MGVAQVINKTGNDAKQAFTQEDEKVTGLVSIVSPLPFHLHILFSLFPYNYLTSSFLSFFLHFIISKFHPLLIHSIPYLIFIQFLKLIILHH